MARYIEILFQYWTRFVIVAVLLPIPLSLVALIYFRTYSASTDLWVDAPTYLGSPVLGSPTQAAGWNQYLTPAQNQVDSLTQMLATGTFIDSIDQDLATSGIPDQSVRRQALNSIPTSMKVTAQGSHLMSITFSCQRREVCIAVLSATARQFQARLTTMQKDQADLSIAFLNGQLVPAQERLKASEDALRNYLIANPGLQALSANQIISDPQLDRLTQAAQSDRNEVTQLQAQVDQATYLGAAAASFVKANTEVLDAPTITKGGLTGDGSSLRHAAVVPLVCITAAVAYLLLLAWFDKTARDPREMEGRLQVPVLTSIPQLKAAERF